MSLSILTLISALSISATAAYFSIVGLATMFPGSQGAIIIMGSVLEVGKIIAAIWVHLNWKKISFLLKSYLCFAVFTLMLITSMGIFGFLSKSYILHEAEANKEIAKVEQIQKQINREKDLITKYEKTIEESNKNQSKNDNTKIDFIKIEEDRILKISSISKESIEIESSNINRWQLRLKELDDIIAEINSKSGLFSNSKKKAQEEELKQKDERENLAKKISESENSIKEIQNKARKDIEEIQKKITDFQNAVIENSKTKNNDAEIQSLINDSESKIEGLEQEKFTIEKSVSALEVEVGPVKYIAELFNDFSSKEMGIGTAIRMIIIALIFVFDPLAIVMVIAATSSIANLKKQEKEKEENSALEKINNKIQDINIEQFIEFQKNKKEEKPKQQIKPEPEPKPEPKPKPKPKPEPKRYKGP